MSELGGYFSNSVNAWHDELVARQRKLAARLVTLERMNHPSAYGQSVLIEINDKLIDALLRHCRNALLKDALARSDAAPATDVPDEGTKPDETNNK